jgi:hypothetical protein
MTRTVRATWDELDDLLARRPDDPRNRHVLYRTPWYLWPFVIPGMFLGAIVMLPLGVLAVLSIPYFILYPERHLHEWDIDENLGHERSMRRWRAAYARLTLLGRVCRARVLAGRRRRRARGHTQ